MPGDKMCCGWHPPADRTSDRMHECAVTTLTIAHWGLRLTCDPAGSMTPLRFASGASLAEAFVAGD